LKKIALATIALAGLGSAFATVPAHAAAPSGPGAVCQFSSTTDPTVEGDVQTGQISGGPLVTVNVDSTNPTASGPQSGTLHCWVQVASDVPTSGPGVSGHGTGVVTAGPAQITYTATVDQNVYLCSTWTDDADGVTYYFNDTTSDFSATVSPCGLAVSASTPAEDPLAEQEKLLDTIICPVLAIVFPPEGDIAGIWDCPPYGN
jgi:hypothetical protein